MLNYTLGTIEASEALIKDLYIDLRAKVNAWSKITQQTPQARMGYVGQHTLTVYRFKIIIIAPSVYMLIVLTTFRNTLVLFQIQYNYACY